MNITASIGNHSTLRAIVMTSKNEVGGGRSRSRGSGACVCAGLILPLLARLFGGAVAVEAVVRMIEPVAIVVVEAHSLL